MPEHLLLEALHQVLEAVIPRAVVHVVLTRVTTPPTDVAAVGLVLLGAVQVGCLLSPIHI